MIYTRSLPFTSANSAVRVFRHALSLDEVPNYKPRGLHLSDPGFPAPRAIPA